MMLNVSTYMGHWPFRPLPTETLDGVAAIAQKEGSTHIITANLNGLFYQNCQKANEELYAQLQSYKGDVKVLPFAMINPTYIAWEKDLATCLDTYGFKGVELSPAYHRYAWDDPKVVAFYKMCGENNIPVRINNSFENMRQRNLNDFQGECIAEIPKLVTTDKKTLSILTQAVPGHLWWLPNMAAEFENFYVDISRIAFMTHPTSQFLLINYPIERFCYGSLLPFQYGEAVLPRLYYAEISDEQKDNILFGTLAKKLGL